MLFALWTSKPLRPTKDLNLLGSGDPSAEVLAGIIWDICRIERSQMVCGLILTVSKLATYVRIRSIKVSG